MKRVWTVVVCGLVASCAVAIAAQQTVSASGKGTVTGSVTFGDTQRPARFADVVLIGVPAKLTMAKQADPSADLETQMETGIAGFADIGKTIMVQSRTGADGSFVADDVQPGDYYAFAAAAGYVTPVEQVEKMLADGADPNKPLPSVPIVHVVADHGANTNLMLTRGGSISGTISWDDGSPVTGAIMKLATAKGDAPRPPQQLAMLAITGALGQLSISDDTGHFRIAGIAPGDYVIMATIQTGQPWGLGRSLTALSTITPLVLYSPSAFRKSEAKAITVHVGEDLGEQNMTLALGSLHSVSGQITSVEDHHGINEAAVKLVDTQDKTFIHSASVDAAGNFTVTFVPPGTYTMKVQDAADTEARKPDPKAKFNLFGNEKTLRRYKDGEAGVVVADSDLTGQNVALAVDTGASTTKQETDMNNLVKGVTGLMAPPPPPPAKP